MKSETNYKDTEILKCVQMETLVYVPYVPYPLDYMDYLILSNILSLLKRNIWCFLWHYTIEYVLSQLFLSHMT